MKEIRLEFGSSRFKFLYFISQQGCHLENVDIGVNLIKEKLWANGMNTDAVIDHMHTHIHKGFRLKWPILKICFSQITLALFDSFRQNHLVGKALNVVKLYL